MFFTLSGNRNQEYSCGRRINLTNEFRLVWEQHVWWTRETIKSMVNSLPDVDVVTKRLLQNPADMAKIFAMFYPPMVTKKIEELITEHLEIAGALITALKAGDTAGATVENDKWYKNADEIAKIFGSINRFYSEEEVRKMFYQHLDLTKREVEELMQGKYQDSVMTFDQIEREALEMADYFSGGIMRQFSNKF